MNEQDMNEDDGGEIQCQPGGNYGLCKSHPTCELVQKMIDRLIANKQERPPQLIELYNGDWIDSLSIRAIECQETEPGDSIQILPCVVIKCQIGREFHRSVCQFPNNQEALNYLAWIANVVNTRRPRG